MTEYLWSSRHFSRAPAAAGAAPVQRPRFRRSRSGKHVAETPSYCRYQARFLYKPRTLLEIRPWGGKRCRSVFGRTTTKWSNHQCPFHVGGSVRIRSNNGGREFRDLLSPFRDETLIRRERAIDLERAKYMYASDRFSFFQIFFSNSPPRGTLIKPRPRPEERIKLGTVCIRQLYFNVNFRRSGRRFINSPLFSTRTSAAINSVSTARSSRVSPFRCNYPTCRFHLPAA